MTRPAPAGLSSFALRTRAFADAPVASLLVALLVAVAAFLAVVAPRVVEALHTEALRTRLDTTSPIETDLVATSGGQPQLGPPVTTTTLDPRIDAVFGAQEEHLRAIRDALPEPLRRATDDPLAIVRADPLVADVPDSPPSSPIYRVQLTADPRQGEHFTLRDGAWPVPLPAPPMPEAPDPNDPSTWSGFQQAEPIAAPLEIALAADVADAMDWSIGESRLVSLTNGTLEVRLTGTLDAVDAADRMWKHQPTALQASVLDDGLGPIRYWGQAFVDPGSWAALAPQPIPIELRAWLPIDVDAVRAADSAALVEQIGEVESTFYPLDDSESGYGTSFGRWMTVGSVSFSSGLATILDEQAAESAAVDAVLATVASGPIGVMVAVLVLGSRVVFERRRGGLELAEARGAGGGWLTSSLLGEGLAIGLPAGLAGGAVAVALTADEQTSGGWLVAAVFALTPAVLLTASVSRLSPLRRSRTDLGANAGRFRWVWESLVVIVAAASVALLVGRGPTAAAGVDVLLAAVPLLLALVGCIVVLRVYPLPLRALTRAAERGRGLVAFLGAARALRDPSAGLLPVLAVVVGVTVAVFSSVALATVHDGAIAAAETEIGADASLASAPLTRDQLAGLASVPGVEAIGPVYSTAPTTVEIDGQRRTATLIVVDVAEMREVQAGRTGVPDLPDVLAREASEGAPVPVVVSDSVAESIAGGGEVAMNGSPIDVVGTFPGASPFAPRTNWILIDLANARPFADVLVPRQALVRFTPGADTGAAAAELLRIARGSFGVWKSVVPELRTPADAASELLDRPNARGLAAGLMIAISLTTGLATLALVLALVVGRPARARLLPLLAVLGLGRRGERALVAWELAPIVAVAVAVGVGLGVLMPYAVLPGIDLTGFTGGAVQPAIVVDWPFVAAVAVGAILVAGAAVALASTGRRSSAARGGRAEEEG
ncbi:hypothetical protein ET445_07640 [Agromyces protaetiae]|uniref:ABC3 transporter permease C-terminal domain-containing protein n=1 Tax=Agromyces protaetiae TaxID=2509455 RepID=A0A4P6FRS4_9MICO|nr:hypothetical protein [Agromyces protaetiae]QAY73238.1 hypothetical protein ET445_07640 [Agromyces protaetiae]